MNRKDRNKTIIDNLGDSAPPLLSLNNKKLAKIDTAEIKDIIDQVQVKLQNCNTSDSEIVRRAVWNISPSLNASQYLPIITIFFTAKSIMLLNLG